MNEEETMPVEEAADDELGRVRELILSAHQDLAPELIAGETVKELIDSIETAREVYRSVIARMAPAVPDAPAVPAGSAPVFVDPASLPPHELIRRGLRTARRA